MFKHLTSCFLAASLLTVPAAWAQDTTSPLDSPSPAATSALEDTTLSSPSPSPETNLNVEVDAAPPVSVPAPDVNVDVQAPAPPPASAPSSTTIHVDAPPAVTAPSPSSTTVVRESSSRVVQVDDHEDDTNWGLIVGAGLIGLTVVALVLSSRRTV